MSVSPQINKETRPFMGIIVLLNERKYCIPLTSPNKDKFQRKSKIDFIKILDPSVKDKNGKEKTIGVLNINNMIPVDEAVIKKIDLTLLRTDSQDVRRRKSLMIDQLDWCRNNYATIENRANKVYRIVTETPEKNRNLVRRCCDFKRLEKVLDLHLSKNTFVEKPPVEHSNKHKLIYPLSRKQLAKNTKISKGKETSKSKDKSVHKKKNKPNLE